MKAWELIADPTRWTQHDWARDANGKGCWRESPSAVCWCARAAVRQVYGGDETGNNIILKYYRRYKAHIEEDNDRPGMTAAVMSERLRVVEEEVLASLSPKETQ